MFVIIIFIISSFILGCTPKKEAVITQEHPEAKPSERDDLGCWPPSCSVIPQPDDQKRCEDWKAGRKVQWGDCGIYSSIQPVCQKLCESEKVSSAPVEQQKQQVVAEQQPCNLPPLQRQFSNTPYYTGLLIDDHFHMPQMQKIPNNPDAPVLDQDLSKRDVACLFDNERIKYAFAFYGIPLNLKDKALQDVKDIEQQYPGKIMHFIELVSFPGYPVVPSQVDEILNLNQDLFKGYGELSLYLDFYRITKPNDPQFRELYKIAEKHHLIVMMHPVEEQVQAIEEVVRDYPNVQFLFHGAESLPSANKFYDTFLDKYPNAYYSVDITLVEDALMPAKTKQEFITLIKKNWQSMLNKKVSLWKNRIEKHPNQFLWGTDRGHYAWHYDPEVEAWLEEFGRTFIGQLDPAVQEKYAYKNAESLLQKR